MSKPVKEMIARELTARYGSITNAVWVELVGVDGITTNDFRRSLRAKRMRLEVVKTSLFKRACAVGPMLRLAEALEGPVSLLTGGESAIEVGKVLLEWKPKLPTLRLRGAVLEGEYLDESAVQELARMPSRKDLQSQLVGAFLSPGGKLVSAILSGGGGIAGCLKALADKLEKGEPVAKAG